MIKKILILFLLFPVQIIQAVGSDSLLAGQYYARAQYLYEKDHYDSLVWYYTAAFELSRSGDSLTAARCLLGMAEHNRIAVEFDSVKIYLDRYNRYAEDKSLEDPFLKADYHYIKGKLARDVGDHRTAINEISSAISIVEDNPDRGNRLARYLNMLGTVYDRMNDIDSAEIMYNLCYAEIQQSDLDLAIERSWYYGNIGKVYEAKGQYEKVLDNYSESIRFKIEEDGDTSPELANIYLKIASFYTLMARPDSANVYLEKARQVIETNPVAKVEYSRTLYLNRGTMHYNAGNYVQGLVEYKQALLEAMNSLGSENSWVYLYYNNIGTCEYMLGNYAEALEYYNEGFRLVSKLHPSKRVLTYHYLARTYARLGNTKKATEYYDMLIASRQKYFSEYELLLAADKEAYGGFLYEQGNIEGAVQNYRDALKIREHHFGLRHRLTAQVLLTLGELYVNENQFDSAIDYLQKGLISSSDFFADTLPGSNPLLSDLVYHLEAIRILKLKAFVMDRLAASDTLARIKITRLLNAAECLGLAVDAIHQMHTTWISDESRMYLSEHERATFLSLVDALIKLHKNSGDEQYLSQAYKAVEQVKYSTLLSVIEDQDALQVGNVPRGLQIREQELKDQISVYNNLVRNEMQSGDPDSLKMLTWSEKLYEYNNQRRDLIRSIERRYPEYHRLKYDNNSLNADDVQRRVGEDEILVEYLLRDTLLQIFAIDQEGIRYFQTGLKEEFYSDLQMVLEYIKLDYYQNSDGPAQEFCSAANRLYNNLFGEINIEPEKNIIIIPDGALAYLPFDVLLTDHVDAKEFMFNELPYLLFNNPVRYAYSATLMYRSGRWVNRARKNLIAFAPSAVKVDSLPASDQVRDIDVDRNNLAPLKFAESEVRAIKNIIGGDLMLGMDASESAFKAMAYRYRVLHMAMHALIDDNDPLNTKLIFSEDSLEEQDGFLNVYEIYGLNLNAQMVVLSGCNSGTGIMQQGEGIISLARAFFYCGVPNIVMTLWTVYDESGEILMTRFYRDLVKGSTKETALRNAKLNFLENAEPIHQHPYFWSGFVIIGDNEAVFKPRAVKFLFIGLLFIIAIFGIVYKNRLSRKKGLDNEKEGLQAF